MRLEKASYKAIKYACLKFHYARSVPANPFGYCVFNEKKEWCGVVVFGTGSIHNIGKKYSLSQGQCIELVRMALNGKQHKTSKCLAMALKLIRKDLPLLKLIVSYADSEQNHKGIIYQATNWLYTNDSIDKNLLVDGVRTHRRSFSISLQSSLDKKGLSR